MKKILLAGTFLCFASGLFAQGKVDSWSMFAKTKFESRYYENLGEYLFFPLFTEELKKLDGKEITVQGYYVPFAPEDGDYIVLSKFPMSQCYFCGGGGPESVVEVYFSDEDAKFTQDDLITIKGKLKLNEKDMEHMPFMITDGVLVSK
jgi:uncharacterized membrane protein YcgQ (UPF0703/DUF1980 family)